MQKPRMMQPVIRYVTCAAIAWWCCSSGAFGGAPLGQGYEFEGNGKRPRPLQSQVWQEDEKPPAKIFPAEAGRAAQLNIAAANNPARGNITCGNLSVSPERWLRTARLVAEALNAGKDLSTINLTRYLCRGEDGQGNVHFTGYFTPRLNARKNPDAAFRYPLYRLPTGLPKPLPTREAIDRRNALAGRGLELALSLIHI